MLKPEEIDFTPLENAIKTFKKAVEKTKLNDLERDGAIQRFEFTFELCWKFARRLLFSLGKKDVSASPRPLLRDAHQENLISDVKAWFEFLDARNNTSHLYDEIEAEKVFRKAVTFPAYAEKLLTEMKKRTKK